MTRKEESRRVRSNTKVILKIFLTLLAGGTAFLITHLSSESLIWELTMSVLTGGIALLVQFLNDFENRLEKVEQKQEVHTDEIRSLIKDGFVKTNKATELFQAVEASALQTDAVIQLVRNSAQISPASPPLIYEFAQLQIDRMSDFLKELSGGGVVEYDGEDRDWLLGLTMQAKHTIDATSLSAVDAGGKGFDGGLWTDDLGLRYLKLQREAMSRGVAIRRIFIVNRPGQTDETEFMRICQQHKNLGIQVKILDRSKILDKILDASLFDFVVFDGVLSYEATPASLIEDSMKPTIVKTHLVLPPERVKERVQRFEELWACAQKLE
jgi:hypothetical protein